MKHSTTEVVHIVKKEKMKIVFLDVDGVLNSSRSVLGRAGPTQTEEVVKALAELRTLYNVEDERSLPFSAEYTVNTIDPVAVALVNRLIYEARALLVLSTSHRNMFVDNAKGAAYGSKTHMYRLGLYFKAMGIAAPIYGITPKLHVERGVEVKQWLDAHSHSVTHYVILDDARDFHSSQPLIWCDPNIGFSSGNFFTASKELGLAETSLIY